MPHTYQSSPFGPKKKRLPDLMSSGSTSFVTQVGELQKVSYGSGQSARGHGSGRLVKNRGEAYPDGILDRGRVILPDTTAERDTTADASTASGRRNWARIVREILGGREILEGSPTERETANRTRGVEISDALRVYPTFGAVGELFRPRQEAANNFSDLRAEVAARSSREAHF